MFSFCHLAKTKVQFKGFSFHVCKKYRQFILWSSVVSNTCDTSQNYLLHKQIILPFEQRRKTTVQFNIKPMFDFVVLAKRICAHINIECYSESKSVSFYPSNSFTQAI